MIYIKNITQLFKSLSDPARVRIVWLLQSGCGLCVCDLIAVLDLPQSIVSRHLAYLRNADLVNNQRKGVYMFYRLPEELNELLAGILSVLQSAAKDVNHAAIDRQRLKEYLTTKTKRANACLHAG
jgi:ArsR family transcriptional regulator